jgi:hypothetical protein
MESRFAQSYFPTGIFEGILMIVDGTECPILRPGSYSVQNLFYSGKKKRHTIKYELGVRITDGKIVWVKGAAPGKTHDNTMLTVFGLENAIEPGKIYNSAQLKGNGCWLIKVIKAPLFVLFPIKERICWSFRWLQIC